MCNTQIFKVVWQPTLKFYWFFPKEEDIKLLTAYTQNKHLSQGRRKELSNLSKEISNLSYKTSFKTFLMDSILTFIAIIWQLIL